MTAKEIKAYQAELKAKPLDELKVLSEQEWATVVRQFEEGLIKAITFVREEDEKDTHHILDMYKTIYEQGQRYSVIPALALCFSSNLEIPKWVKAGYLTALEQLYNGDHTTLDHALGMKRGRGKRGKSHKLSSDQEHKIYARVCELRQQGMAVDDSLFESVGKEFGIGKTLAKETYIMRAGNF